MSLNYDLLPALVELADNDDIPPKLKHAVRDKLNSLAVDVTRELLRIRAELEETLSNVEDHLTRTEPELRATRITLYAEREHFRDFCQHLLKGNPDT